MDALRTASAQTSVHTSEEVSIADSTQGTTCRASAAGYC
jgi:hypothetical protein